MDVITLDVESTKRNREVGTFSGNPHCPDNFVVRYGWTVGNSPVYISSLFSDVPIKRGDLLVGQNTGFDLVFLLKDDNFRHNIWPYIRIWDTQIAEYSLSGQLNKMWSLNKLSEKYGGTQKDDVVAEMLKEKEVDTTEIPIDMLDEYLEDDVLNTRLVYQEQYVKAVELGMLTTIRISMAARQATVCMEYEGMYFDTESVQADILELEGQQAACEPGLIEFMEERLSPWVPEVNVGSNQQISVLLFGKDIPIILEVPVVEKTVHTMYGRQTVRRQFVRYKSGLRKGQIKLIKMMAFVPIKGLLYPSGVGAVKGKDGYYKVDTDELKRWSNMDWVPGNLKLFLRELIKWRGLEKELSTYFRAMKEVTWAHDSCIHGRFNHTKTATDRLSSSEPNMQNISGKERG